ncbi:MAG: hypothetical protein REI11_17805, partial [Patulibacter sp.]|nr:hypothetical protein [Patulibacter sp.]
AVPPRHQRLLLFTLAAHPSVGGGDRIERALRLVEAHAHARASRLVMTLGWGPAWFEAIAQPSPVKHAAPLSDTESPIIDTAVACLHLGADDLTLLDAVDHALTAGAGLPAPTAAAGRAGSTPSTPAAAGTTPTTNAAELDLRLVLTLAERRSGFVGEGLPQQATGDLEDAGGVKVRAASPLFMGFKSGMKKNQATEPGVTIDHGRWMGGTMMHVSRISLTLPSWYRTLTDEQRTLRMHGPGVTVKEAFEPGDGLTPPTPDVAATARKYGVVGHTQAAAVARKRDKPLIIRRDFNGVEHGQPLVHFVALSRTVEDFEATRKAMNADKAVAANPEVGAQVNNGINEWLSVKNRANFLVPPRAARAFPGLRPSEVRS